ncbi:MAG: hypothetical protein OER86_11125, partial [Phycisphaerae bacterium]|nr:hypothetical protein [Phycisphaerae bacterium]
PGMPAHAVVDEAVGLACRALRRGAGDLANAVLRKTATLVAWREADVPWAPGPDMIPWEDGRICLVDPLLPPIEPLDVHLAAATSHPQALVARWLGLFGAEKAIELLRHGLKRPPVILRIGPGTPAETPAKTPDIPDTEPHDETGFRLWRGDAGDLAALLRESPQVWVQDPAAARPVAAVAHLQVERIVDWCAGRGTKTRQLARDHPSARVLAMETDAGRREQLAAAVADCGNVDLLDPSEVSAWHGRCDLVLVDVPCSNSGVYARRHEARYRYGERSTTGLVGLQRRILGEAAGLLAPGGRLLYSTCSIDPHENEDQVAWANEHLGLKVALQQLTLPGGEGRSYHDGGFFALLEPVGAKS